MEQTEGFIAQGEEDKVCKLMHSLYTIHSDPGVYVLHCHHKGGDSEMDMILTLYVNDRLLLGKDQSTITDVKCQPGKLYQMKDLGCTVICQTGLTV